MVAKMPIDYKKYPPDWKAKIVPAIRGRSDGRCECMGECGLHPAKRCVEINTTPAIWAKGKIVLTVAHLCHDTHCRKKKHLRDMCQRCHNRYDNPNRMKNARRNKTFRKEKAGQLRLV